jgi:hypothetical protein
MKGTFVEMYQKMPQKERKRFIQYVESPFFNQNKKVQGLIRALEKQLKAQKTLDKKKVQQQQIRQSNFRPIATMVWFFDPTPPASRTYLTKTIADPLSNRPGMAGAL